MKKIYILSITILILLCYFWFIGFSMDVSKPSHEILKDVSECEMVFAIHDIHSYGKSWVYLVYPNGITKTIYGYTDQSKYYYNQNNFVTVNYFNSPVYYSENGYNVQSYRIKLITPWKYIKLRYLMTSSAEDIVDNNNCISTSSFDTSEMYGCYMQYKDLKTDYALITKPKNSSDDKLYYIAEYIIKSDDVDSFIEKEKLNIE